MNLKAKIYTDETAARRHLERLLWPDGPLCPHCGSLDSATKLKGKSTRPGVYWCNACQKPFSVTVGTVFERSHIPLNKWVLAVELLTSSKKGISSHQLHRMLGVTYKTAWFMSHRIREAMAPASKLPPMGSKGQIIEIDETFIGHKQGAPVKAGHAHKHAIMALVERGGPARSIRIADVRAPTLHAVIEANVSPKANLMTDEAPQYTTIGWNFASHKSIAHDQGVYAKGDVTTNTVEGFFSIFKRGMRGIYQHCGEQHLQRYLHEFDFRYSNREKLGVNDAMRAELAMQGIKGKRLTYRRVSRSA